MRIIDDLIHLLIGIIIEFVLHRARGTKELLSCTRHRVLTQSLTGMKPAEVMMVQDQTRPLSTRDGTIPISESELESELALFPGGQNRNRN